MPFLHWVRKKIRFTDLFLATLVLACPRTVHSNDSGSTSEQSKEPFSATRIAQEALEDPKAAGQFAIPFELLQSKQLNDLPIGVFDSGIGGLTVLETILALDSYNNQTASPGPDGRPDFENERFIYFGDQANMPYGNYSSQGDIHFLRELIVRDAMFLLGKKSWNSHEAAAPTFTKSPVKAIVIACNTATAYGLDDIRAVLKEWKIDIPVIGVVEAGANALVQQLPLRGDTEAIAVMATVGTCSSNAYPKAVERAAGLAGKRVPIVLQQGSLGLAGAIESNPSFIKAARDSEKESSITSAIYQGPSYSNPSAKIKPELLEAYDFEEKGILLEAGQPETSIQLNSVLNYIRFDVVEMLDRYVSENKSVPISKVILGCTHYPFESDRIRQELTRLKNLKTKDGRTPYKHLIADQVELIDPAELTAKELFRTLFQKRLRSNQNQDKLPPKVEGFYLSVANPKNVSGLDKDGNLTNQYKYGRRAGWKSKEDTIPVPLQRDAMPEALAKLLQHKCRTVWAELTQQK